PRALRGRYAGGPLAAHPARIPPVLLGVEHEVTVHPHLEHPTRPRPTPDPGQAVAQLSQEQAFQLDPPVQVPAGHAVLDLHVHDTLLPSSSRPYGIDPTRRSSPIGARS